MAADPPRMPEEQARAELLLLHERFELAARDGLTDEECTELAGHYQRLYARDTSLLEARFNEGVIWETCGQLERAEAIYVELAERQHPHALNNLGVLAWSRADHERARELFERAIAAATPIAALAARNNLATALHQRYTASRSVTDFEAAERQLKNVLAIDSHNQRAYENLARLYYERGRLEDASYLMLAELVVTQAQRVLELDGVRSAELYNLRGLLWMEEDDPARAIRAFQQAVELAPNHADANRNLAMIAIRFRDFARAEQALEAAASAAEAANDVEVWLALGVARRGLQDYDGAEAAYRHALELAPDDPRAVFNLGVLAQDHRTATTDDEAELAEHAEHAAELFRVFVIKAGHPRWREQVAEANDRIAIAEDTVETLEIMERLQRDLADSVARAEAEAEAQREALRELEAEAISVEALLAGDPPVSP